MGKIRRGNFVFVYWIGDHSPRHVKWDLDNGSAMQGRASAQIKRLIRELEAEGKL